MTSRAGTARRKEQERGAGGRHDRPARRMTKRASEYQAPRPDRPGRRHGRGASALTRGPSSASTAGRTTSATVPPTSETSTPPTPIERRNRCGKTSSDAIAAATVSELKTTVRPALAIVRATAPSRAVGELLAVARHDEQAPVDREPEPHPGDEVEREDRERRDAVASRRPRNESEDRERADERRQQRGDEAAEDPEREQDQQRERDRLRPHESSSTVRPTCS